VEKVKEEKTNIFLVGMMGSGKTTVGKLLANHLEWEFVDTDELIVEETGLSIPVLFKDKGEQYFRRLEQEAVARVARRRRMVVATGGGVILNPENRQVLKENGLVFYLRGTAQVLAARVGAGEGRPLLTGKELAPELERLLAVREKYYQEAADVVLETDALTTGQVVAAILEECAQRGILS